MSLPHLLIAAVVIFVAGNLYRLIRMLRMPAHLRWDLYPIPKGPRERQIYGGSYFEETEWWTKGEERGKFGELRFMLQEVLMLRGVWENFRALWPWSLLLHWALYAYIAATVAVLFSMTFAPMIYVIAAVFGASGAVGLIVVRSMHPRLRPFTTRGTLFNIALLGAIFATIAPVHLGNFVSGLLHGDSIIAHPARLTTHVCLVAFFFAYFPFTHMTHAYMKFFTWHDVRWDDKPAIFDARSGNKLTANVARTASWSATHIAAAGPRSWAEVVASNSGEGGAHD